MLVMAPAPASMPVSRHSSMPNAAAATRFTASRAARQAVARTGASRSYPEASSLRRLFIRSARGRRHLRVMHPAVLRRRQAELAFERAIEGGLRFVSDVHRHLQHGAAVAVQQLRGKTQAPARQVCRRGLAEEVRETLG